MPGGSSQIEHCHEIVRRHDKDRYLTSLFAPDDRRPHLWALYAFNYDDVTHPVPAEACAGASWLVGGVQVPPQGVSIASFDGG